MIVHTAHFAGSTPRQLYQAFLSAEQNSGMTADGRQVVAFRRAGAEVAAGPRAGDELLAFGRRGADGTIEFRLEATLLELIPERRIVTSCRTAAWDAAVVPRSGEAPAPSIVVLEFAPNLLGAELRLAQVGVPQYEVRLPDTGEQGPLEAMVNTHWSVLY